MVIAERIRRETAQQEVDGWPMTWWDGVTRRSVLVYYDQGEIVLKNTRGHEVHRFPAGWLYPRD